MTTTLPKEFEPSKDIALIGLIKKSGFTYCTSFGYSFSHGAYVRKPYSYDSDGLLYVNYSEGRSYGNETQPPTASDKLCEIAQMLLDKGLGVQCSLSEDGAVRSLGVFAYDVKADLDAYNAALAAQAREDAKVSPAVKAERIRLAQERLAEKKRDAENQLYQLKATTRVMFESLDQSVSFDDYERATKQMDSVLRMGRKDFADLQLAFSSVKYAQLNLKGCEDLELKD